MNNDRIISDIKESFDFLIGMRPGQFYAKSYDRGFFFAVNDADSLSNEQKAGIAEFGRDYGLGKAKYAPATPQEPARYVFQGDVADLRPAEAMAKKRKNQETLRELRESKPIIGEGSDPAYRSTEPTEGWKNRRERVREERRQDRIKFRKKHGLAGSVSDNGNESAVDSHRRQKKLGDADTRDPTLRKIKQPNPTMRR